MTATAAAASASGSIYSRTIRKVPEASKSKPTTFSALTGSLVTPSQPNWSTATDIASWPEIVAAVTPPAPSVRTVTSTVVT